MLILSMLIIGVLLQDAPAKSQVPEHLAHHRGFQPQPGARYWDLSIAYPMSFEEWETYATILKLSKEQRKALEASYDEYRQSDWAFRVARIQPLFDRSAEIAASGVNQLTPELAAQRVELYRARDKVVPDLVHIERAFFSGFAEYLAESQLELLEVVRLMRERSHDMRFGSTFPGFKFDLDSTLLALSEAGVDVTPRDREVFSHFVQAWRGAAGALYARHAEDVKRGVESLRLRAEMNAAYERGQDDLGADLHARLMRLREPATRTARRIHDLHASYVQLVSEQLPTAASQRIRDEFERTAYKPFTPDFCDPSPFFEELLHVNLSNEQRTPMIELRDAWRTSDRAARNRMIVHYLDWNEKTCTMKSYVIEEYLQYSQRMGVMLDSRLADTEAAMVTALEILTNQHRSDGTKRADKWRKAVAQSRAEHEKIKTRFGGWPAPFD